MPGILIDLYGSCARRKYQLALYKDFSGTCQPYENFGGEKLCGFFFKSAKTKAFDVLSWSKVEGRHECVI